MHHTTQIYWRLSVPKIIDIGPDLLEIFENILGVRFFLRHSVVTDLETENIQRLKTSATHAAILKFVETYISCQNYLQYLLDCKIWWRYLKPRPSLNFDLDLSKEWNFMKDKLCLWEITTSVMNKQTNKPTDLYDHNSSRWRWLSEPKLHTDICLQNDEVSVQWHAELSYTNRNNIRCIAVISMSAYRIANEMNIVQGPLTTTTTTTETKPKTTN